MHPHPTSTGDLKLVCIVMITTKSLFYSHQLEPRLFIQLFQVLQTFQFFLHLKAWQGCAWSPEIRSVEMSILAHSRVSGWVMGRAPYTKKNRSKESQSKHPPSCVQSSRPAALAQASLNDPSKTVKKKNFKGKRSTFLPCKQGPVQ